MRQRLGPGSGVIGKAKLVMLDEPRGLDPVATAICNRLLRLLRDSGTGIVLLGSHVLPGVELTCTSARRFPDRRRFKGRRNLESAAAPGLICRHVDVDATGSFWVPLENRRFQQVPTASPGR